MSERKTKRYLVRYKGKGTVETSGYTGIISPQDWQPKKLKHTSRAD